MTIQLFIYISFVLFFHYSIAILSFIYIYIYIYYNCRLSQPHFVDSWQTKCSIIWKALNIYDRGNSIWFSLCHLVSLEQNKFGIIGRVPNIKKRMIHPFTYPLLQTIHPESSSKYPNRFTVDYPIIILTSTFSTKKIHI